MHNAPIPRSTDVSTAENEPRAHFWATTDPPPNTADRNTDLAALEEGSVTLTPLNFDLTCGQMLETMQDWGLRL